MDKDDLYQKVLIKAIAFLGYKPRTRQEIVLRLNTYLRAYKKVEDSVKEDVARKVIDYLVQNKLIDDREFIQMFTAAKFGRSKAFGKKVIEDKLVAKGINRADAGEYINATITEEDELKAAAGLLEKKFRSKIAAQVPISIRGRMGRFLVSRGFSYAIAKQAVDYLVKRP